MTTSGGAGRDNRTSRLALAILVLVFLTFGLFYRYQVQRESAIHERSGLVMGTFVSLRAAGPRAPVALDAALDELDRVERLFSYNIPGSDVSRLNDAAGRGPVDLDAETILVLTAAQRIAELSGGAFDATVAPLVDAWGFRPDVEEQQVPTSGDLAAALARVDYRRLRVDTATNQAELLDAGMAVDLGGIAKGYAVDRVAAVLRDHGVTSALIDVGGNVYGLGLRPDGQPWRIGLQHPRDTTELLGIMPLTERSIATSGDYQRFFVQDGETYHHVIDPHTGWPATAMISIAIVAPTGMEADAVSTAAFVLGPQDGLALVRSLGFEAVMYTNDGQVQVTGGLQPLLEAPR